LDQRAAAIAVDAARVGDVVAIRLEPADRRVFAVEDPVARAESSALSARRERPVVAHLRRALRAALIQTESAVLVVGLPRPVGGLKQQIRMARIVADDEDDVALAAGVGPRQLRDVDARGGGPR